MTIETWTYFAGFLPQNKSSEHSPGPSYFKFLRERRTVRAYLAQNVVTWDTV